MDYSLMLGEQIYFLLTRQITSAYVVQVEAPERITQQKVAYTTLLQQWNQADPAKIDEVLAKRAVIDPEPELRPEIVTKLQRKIADKRFDARGRLYGG
ncbi:hypothetical protein QUF63_03055 [Anaerolineales bacterium HSG25]|nr:hypothetical protein [Anaerolineales bacterium HSG25]